MRDRMNQKEESRNSISQDKMMEQLIKRTQESYDRKDGDATSKYFLPDSELPFWKCTTTKEDPHIIDIIPFYAGDRFPTELNRRNPVLKDDYVYVLEVFVHSGIGPAKEMILCPLKNYGKPCPVCEEIDIQIKEGREWEEYSDIAPKRRCVYNIICYDSDKEEKKGIQIWEVSHKYSEKPFQSLAKNPREGGIIPFAALQKDAGMSISFEVAGDTYKTISGHKFLPRNYDIPRNISDDAYALDQHLLLRDYDYIKEKLQGGAWRSGKTETSNFSREQPSDSRRQAPKPTQQDDSRDSCPCEHEFGVDADRFDDCENCEIYKDCSEEFDRRRASAKLKRR